MWLVGWSYGNLTDRWQPLPLVETIKQQQQRQRQQLTHAKQLHSTSEKVDDGSRVGFVQLMHSNKNNHRKKDFFWRRLCKGGLAKNCSIVISMSFNYKSYSKLRISSGIVALIEYCFFILIRKINLERQFCGKKIETRFVRENKNRNRPELFRISKRRSGFCHNKH